VTRSSDAGISPVLTSDRPDWIDDLVAGAWSAGEDVAPGLRLASGFGHRLPPPGRGRTVQRWQALAEVAAADLTAARILEAHSDALAILDEADQIAEPGTWGVFAAEAPGVRVDAEVIGADAVLRGTKPWCSLAGVLDRCLITAHTPTGRQLFACDLRQPAVHCEPASGWVARGLRNVASAAVHLDGARARSVGPVDWYLQRSGFAWGGLGVAACWYGGAVGLANRLSRQASAGGGELIALHVGAADAALHAAAATLRDAARQVDDGLADGAAGARLALRVRTVVHDAAEQVSARVGRALGPAPLAFEEEHARRAADLQLYLRQHHGERDVAALGRAVLDVGP
jgi:hypothetical protein